ncbi:Uncharacterised protein [Nocardia otitidiscaviarum]|uniref:Uncharacterized protein n=1 Tax=Nocardia otitidiscaviarum TaxID=1823 RepID=A0A378YFW5_9NOCA|nr:Uncharacterised protein [Nocardia otitidiscaviarum]
MEASPPIPSKNVLPLHANLHGRFHIVRTTGKVDACLQDFRRIFPSLKQSWYQVGIVTSDKSGTFFDLRRLLLNAVRLNPLPLQIRGFYISDGSNQIRKLQRGVSQYTPRLYVLLGRDLLSVLVTGYLRVVPPSKTGQFEARQTSFPSEFAKTRPQCVACLLDSTHSAGWYSACGMARGQAASRTAKQYRSMAGSVVSARPPRLPSVLNAVKATASSSNVHQSSAVNAFGSITCRGSQRTSSPDSTFIRVVAYKNRA